MKDSICFKSPSKLNRISSYTLAFSWRTYLGNISLSEKYNSENMLEFEGKFDVAAQMEAAMADNSAACDSDFGKQQTKRQSAVVQGRSKVERTHVSVRNGNHCGSQEKRLAENNVRDNNNDGPGDPIAEEGAVATTIHEKKMTIAPPIVAVTFPTTSSWIDHDGGGAFPILPSPSSLSSHTFKEHRKSSSTLWPEWICNMGCDGSSDIIDWLDNDIDDDEI